MGALAWLLRAEGKELNPGLYARPYTECTYGDNAIHYLVGAFGGLCDGLVSV